MNPSRILLAMLVLAFIAAPWATCQQPPAAPKNIILIGWDGAQRNHVKECLERGELPSLKQLSSEGALVAIDVVRTTDTKAGWSQILTGYNPEITGVFSNARYQPIPENLTVFERLERHFGPEAFVTVAVIGKKGHVDAEGPQKIRVEDQKGPDKKPAAGAPGKKGMGGKRAPEGKIVVEDGVRYRVTPGKPYFLMKDHLDVWVNGLEKDEVVGTKAIAYLDQYKDKPFFFFVHFAEVDHSGHRCGENSKEYNDALISADTWTGRIVQKLKDLGLYGQTLVYVTADHGFDEGQMGHPDAPYVFLGTNDPQVMRNGERADIAPTILKRFGVDLNALTPPLSGHPLTEAYQPAKW